MRKYKYVSLPVQAAFMCGITALVSIAPYLLYGALDSGTVITLSAVLSWILVPLGGAVSAYRVTRCGVNEYLSWILPPVCYGGLPWLVIGYPPSAGVMLTAALASVVGAAAGAVKNQMEQTKE